MAVHTAVFAMMSFANCRRGNANRRRDNRFAFDGRDWQISPNTVDTRLNFHGSDWRLPWQIGAVAASAATLPLTLTLDGDDGIWCGAARQTFALNNVGPSVE